MQYHMLLSTTYGLNNSYTKKIHVGLQTSDEGIFAPVVKLSGNNADGIYFDVDSWHQFQEIMPIMTEYLCEDSRSRPNPVTIKNIVVNFTTSYSTKSILVAYKQIEEERVTANISEEATDSAPPAKKRRTYAVAIVMQKSTFLGLENIVKCANSRLEHLSSLSESVNACAQFLIKEIELKLPKNFINYDIVKLTLKGNCDDIESNVRRQINDLPFLDAYFNIVFLELSSLRFNEIVHKIMTNRNSAIAF